MTFPFLKIAALIIFLSNIPNIANLQKIDSLISRLGSLELNDKIETYKEIITFYTRFDPQKSLHFAEEALKISKSNNYKKGEADILYLMGVSSHALSEFKNSLKYYEESYEIRKEIKDSVGIGECLNRIGLIYNVKGDFAKALDYAIQAIRILENQNDKKALGRAYNYLGIAYYVAKDVDKAEEVSLDALYYNKTIDDDLILAISHEHLAIIYIKKRNFEKAIDHVNSTIELRSKNLDSLGLAGSYENMALIYRIQNKYSQALKYYEKSLQLKEKLNSQRGLASTLAGIGVTYQKMGNYSKSIELLKRSIEIRKRLGDMRGMVSSLEQISEAYETINDNKNALKYIRLAQTYNDSLLNEQKNRAIAELQEEFQNERKEKEILLLQKENTIQKQFGNFLILLSTMLIAVIILIFIGYRSKRKMNKFLQNTNKEITEQKEELQKLNDQLKELNATKNKLFSIIAHDLKSPFQGMIGLTEIIDEDFDELTKDEIKNYNILIRNATNNIYKLLENLLEWTQLQRDLVKLEITKINLSELVNTIIEIQSTNARNKNIKIVNSISDDIFVNADKNMILTVLRNLLSNAIKYTPKDGIIEVFFEQKDSFTKVCVKDTGIGIPSKMLKNIFNVGEKTSRPGTEGEPSTGLGLVLCKEYIDKHKGEISVESEEHVGTTFCFTVPK